MFNFFKKNETPKTHKVSAIVVAAGQSSRMGTEASKQFIEILGKPVLAYSLEALQNSPSIDEIIVVTREIDILIVSDIIREYGIKKATNIIVGGETRQQSVQNGLNEITDAEIIVIHDGARPCVLPQHIEETILAAQACGAAALGFPASDTLKTVNSEGVIIGTVERNGVWQIQTPQVFKNDIIRKAYENADENGMTATDDCALVEKLGVLVSVVCGASSNIKITTQDDVYIARGIIEGIGEE